MIRVEGHHWIVRCRRHRFFAISALYVLLLGACAIVLKASAADRIADPRGPLIGLFMTWVLMVLFLCPLLGMQSLVFRQSRIMILPTPQEFSKAIFHRWISACKVTLALCTAPCIAAFAHSVLFGSVPASDIVQPSIVLMSIAASATALGSYCALALQDRYSAAGVALLAAVAICTEPVWIAPILESTSHISSLIQGSLLINPIAGMASALDFDIFRTEPWYQICPIGQRRFQYPSWYSVASFHLLVSVFLLWRSRVCLFRMAMPSL